MKSTPVPYHPLRTPHSFQGSNHLRENVSDMDSHAKTSDTDARRRRHDKHTRHRDTRSLSPRRDDQPSKRHSRSKGDHLRKSERTQPSESVALPFGTKSLSKDDMMRYKPLFGMYLDIQKGIELEDLDERESKGRWKSFVGKW